MDIIKLREGVKFRKEDFGGLIFDPKRAMILEINKSGLCLLEILQKGSEKEKLMNKFDIAIQKDVSKFLEILKKIDLIKEVDVDGKNV